MSFKYYIRSLENKDLDDIAVPPPGPGWLVSYWSPVYMNNRYAVQTRKVTYGRAWGVWVDSEEEAIKKFNNPYEIQRYTDQEIRYIRYIGEPND